MKSARGRYWPRARFVVQHPLSPRAHVFDSPVRETLLDFPKPCERNPLVGLQLYEGTFYEFEVGDMVTAFVFDIEESPELLYDPEHGIGKFFDVLKLELQEIDPRERLFFADPGSGLQVCVELKLLGSSVKLFELGKHRVSAAFATGPFCEADVDCQSSLVLWHCNCLHSPDSDWALLIFLLKLCFHDVCLEPV